MTNLILLFMSFGVVLSIFGFLLSTIYLNEKFSDNKILIISLLSTLPGVMVFSIANHFRQEIPKIISSSCGTVKQYKQYSIKGTRYERLEIVMDGSGYLYYFAFDPNQSRLQEKQHVCFTFYDRFKNKGMGKSILLEIAQSTNNPKS